MYCSQCGTHSNDQMKYCYKCGTPLQAGAQQSHDQVPRYQAFSNVSMHETAESGGQYAGFWIRFAAYLLDVIFFIFATFLLGLVIGVSAFVSGDENTGAFLGTLYNIVNIFGFLLYKTIMDASSTQGTLGKMIVGIKIIDAYGRKISFGRSIGRYLSMILSGLILCIGYMMAGWTANKQALHDLIASTYVVYKR